LQRGKTGISWQAFPMFSSCFLKYVHNLNKHNYLSSKCCQRNVIFCSKCHLYHFWYLATVGFPSKCSSVVRAEHCALRFRFFNLSRCMFFCCFVTWIYVSNCFNMPVSFCVVRLVFDTWHKLHLSSSNVCP
jgi:hypothetical protein